MMPFELCNKAVKPAQQRHADGAAGSFRQMDFFLSGEPDSVSELWTHCPAKPLMPNVGRYACKYFVFQITKTL